MFFMVDCENNGWELRTSNFQKPYLESGNFQRKIISDVNFNSDFLPNHPSNQEAARQRNLRYGFFRGFYVDEDGCLIRDRFGQELG